MDLIARGDQRLHPQAPIGLDADDDVAGIRCVLGNECVEPGKT